jgi:hypothetical protein
MAETLIAPDPSPIEARFTEQAELWRLETGPLSSITAIAMHPAYQRIIGMETAVLPCLLRALEQKPEQWFWALQSITSEDPVAPEQRGRVVQIAQTWLLWAKVNRPDVVNRHVEEVPASAWNQRP